MNKVFNRILISIAVTLLAVLVIGCAVFATVDISKDMCKAISGAIGDGFDKLILYSSIDPELCKASVEHLEGKYGKRVVVEKYTYDFHGDKGIIAHFEDMQEISFFSSSTYDYYLSRHLETDAENRIFKKCKDKMNDLRIVCHLKWYTTQEDELLDFYNENGKPITFEDDECVEELNRIVVSYSPKEDFDIDDAENVAAAIVAIFGKEVLRDCYLSFNNISTGVGGDYAFDILNGEITRKNLQNKAG